MYFERQGKQNTEETLKIAFEAAKELGIHDLVIATSTGASLDFVTAQQTKDFNVVAVTCASVSYTHLDSRIIKTVGGYGNGRDKSRYHLLW